MKDKISMTREQFNALNASLAKTYDHIRNIYEMSDSAFRLFLEISALMENVKKNYIKENEETNND
jgi:hypothetical protein